MKRLLTLTAVVAMVAIVGPALAQWIPVAPDPGLWPYADGPTQEVVTLPHNTYRLASCVGWNPIEMEEQIFSVGGVSLITYSRDAPGSDPKYWGNRQSRFGIYLSLIHI